MVTSDGEVVGEHGGYARYTVGQRKGLGGGRGRALYVLGVHPATQQVVVGDHDELFLEHVTIRDLNWLREPPVPGDALRVQLRHRAAAVEADRRPSTTARRPAPELHGRSARSHPGSRASLYPR
jgi:tRNA-uridine 2-sulfurtransferase